MYGAVHKTLPAEVDRTCDFYPAGAAFDVVAIAASAGGIEALTNLLAGLPDNFPAAILVAQHLGPVARYRSVLDQVLSRHTRLRVKWAEDGESVRAGTVFLAPQDRHLLIDSSGILHVTPDPEVNRARPAADPLFASVAAHFGARAIAIVLSGALRDGAEGAWNVARSGGRVLAQDRASSFCFDMPSATLEVAGVDFMFSPEMIAHTLISLVMVPGAAKWLRVWRAIRPEFCTPTDSV